MIHQKTNRKIQTKKRPTVVDLLLRAEKGARTLDIDLGKVALYQLSYFRVVL